jgi:4-hydroxybenzoate polyprenyltransferase
MQRGYMINENNSQTPRTVWLIKHKKILLYSVGISLITVMFLCNNLSWTSIAIMVGAEIISTIYYLPPFNLRKHGYIKPFLISLIWVISCSAVPLLENHLMNLQNSTFILGQFLLLSVLCLLFDIKDAELDLMSGINTYANKFGITATRLICLLLAMIAAFAFYLFSSDSINYIKLLAFIFLVIATAFYTTKNRHSFYYYLWIDGLLIIETILFI